MSVTFAGNPNEARRRASCKALILASLQSAGWRGRTNRDLNDIAFRFGARILELRREGHAITSVDEGGGRWRFVLDAGPQPGTPGFLASLPAVASIERHRMPITPTPAPAGLLFDL